MGNEHVVVKSPGQLAKSCTGILDGCPVTFLMQSSPSYSREIFLRVCVMCTMEQVCLGCECHGMGVLGL